MSYPGHSLGREAVGVFYNPSRLGNFSYDALSCYILKMCKDICIEEWPKHFFIKKYNFILERGLSFCGVWEKRIQVKKTEPYIDP